MSTTSLLRLTAGLISFSVLARFLGPESFGVLMFWLSVSALITIISNYGLTPYVLREIGANPDSAESIMNEGLTGKLLLTMVVLIISISTAFIAEIDHKQVFFSLLVAALADCFTEFLNAGFRARRRYDVETKIATVSSISHASIMCGAIYIYPTIEVAGGAYAISRLLVLFVTVPSVVRHFAALRVSTFGAALGRLRNTISYAIDFGFQSLFGQVDSVVLNAFVGPTAVGLHQAGMRIFMGGSQVAPILANVFLPRAAASSKELIKFSRESRRIQFSCLIFGCLFGMLLAILAQPIVLILFGSNYEQLIPLMPFFGLLFFLRFACGAWGLILTAAGKQTFRTQIGVIQWVVIGLVAWQLVPALANRGWLVALCVGTFVQGLIYAVRGRSLLIKSWDVLGLTALGNLLFLVWIKVN